jgi:hypothetical protein
MAYDPVRNFVKVNVKQGYDNTATVIQLALGEGNKLPDPATEGQYNLVWWNATDYSDPADDPYKEIVRVVAKSGDQLTILRGQEGTTAQNHNLSGKSYKMMLTLTKKTYEDLQTIEVYKDGTLVGQRARLNFLNFNDISDDATNQRINLNFDEFISLPYWGKGTDGDLILTSGVTTLDLGGKPIFIKNYRNLIIEGTAQLKFSNPHLNGTIIILKVSGTCTITSTASPAIDASGMGAANNQKGIVLKIDDFVNPGGTTGSGQAGAAGGALRNPIGIPGISRTLWSDLKDFIFLTKTFVFFVGGGGGNGTLGGYPVSGGGGGGGASYFWSGGNGGNGGTASGSGVGQTVGTGGRGGGCLIIIAKNLNFTGVISVEGKNGGNGIAGGGAAPGGGGGGGGGSCYIFYNKGINVSGSILYKGGNGGQGGGTGGGAGGSGGQDSNGSNGSSASGENGGGGGGGASGFYLIAQIL